VPLDVRQVFDVPGQASLFNWAAAIWSAATRRRFVNWRVTATVAPYDINLKGRRRVAAD
jgi:hypothetical protein